MDCNVNIRYTEYLICKPSKGPWPTGWEHVGPSGRDCDSDISGRTCAEGAVFVPGSDPRFPDTCSSKAACRFSHSAGYSRFHHHPVPCSAHTAAFLHECFITLCGGSPSFSKLFLRTSVHHTWSRMGPLVLAMLMSMLVGAENQPVDDWKVRKIKVKWTECL